MANNEYLLSRRSIAGAFANMPKLKAEVIQEANKFAASKGKVAVPVSTSDTAPTHGFPSFEYRFRLEDPTNAPAPPK